MKNTTDTTRLVLAEILLKQAKKDYAFYAQRAEVEGTEAMRDAASNALLAVAFYEAEIASLS